MAIFQGGSNLPEDRFINVFHFHDPTLLPFQPAAEECITRVRGFYTTEGTAPALGQNISPYVSRTFTLQAYDLLQPVGERVPVVDTGTLGATTADGLPEEVSVCLTLQGAPPVTPRRRGRLYIGPLTDFSTNYTPANTSTPARPNIVGGSSLGATLAERAGALAISTADTPWCIRSTTPTENFVPIVGGYIDNAFDTQRRRGPDPTTRFEWAATA
jgi:hypothetical protein